MHLYIIYKELLYTVVEPSFLNSSDCVIKVHRRYYVDALQNRIWSGIAGVGVQVVWGPRLGEEGGGAAQRFYSIGIKLQNFLLTHNKNLLILLKFHFFPTSFNYDVFIFVKSKKIFWGFYSFEMGVHMHPVPPYYTS